MYSIISSKSCIQNLLCQQNNLYVLEIPKVEVCIMRNGVLFYYYNIITDANSFLML